MSFTLKVDLKLDPAAVKAKLRAAAMPRLLQCGYLLEARAKELLSEGGGKKLKCDERDAKGHFQKSKTIQVPSAPGEPPHLQSGNLRSSIQTAKTEEGTVVVGPSTTAWYGRVHEFGGKHHPARPFMRPAMDQCVQEFPDKFRALDFSGGEA